MKRTVLVVILLATGTASAAPAEVWLTPARRTQLDAISSRPYIARRNDLGNSYEECVWRNGAREWATTQAVCRIVGTKAKNPHAEAKREAAEARAEKDALLKDIQTLGKKTKVTPAELNAVAEKHASPRGR